MGRILYYGQVHAPDRQPRPGAFDLKQVALLHGGKVGLQNVEGGVDFFIEIPTDKSAD